MIETLKTFLREYGWDSELVEENVLLTGFVDENEFAYPITISIKGELIITQCEFQTVTGALDSNVEVLRSLLNFNYILPMVKIGLDEANAIILAVDMPYHGLAYESFVVGMNFLVEVAQMLPEELGDVIARE